MLAGVSLLRSKPSVKWLALGKGVSIVNLPICSSCQIKGIAAIFVDIVHG